MVYVSPACLDLDYHMVYASSACLVVDCHNYGVTASLVVGYVGSRVHERMC